MGYGPTHLVESQYSNFPNICGTYGIPVYTRSRSQKSFPTLLVNKETIVTSCTVSVERIQTDQIHPSIHGNTAPSRPWPPSEDTSIHPYLQLYSSILLSPAVVEHPSEPHPPIQFLVFPLVS